MFGGGSVELRVDVRRKEDLLIDFLVFPILYLIFSSSTWLCSFKQVINPV